MCGCVKASSLSISQSSASSAKKSVVSLFRNSTLETGFRPFPSSALFSGLICYRYSFTNPPNILILQLRCGVSSHSHCERSALQFAKSDKVGLGPKRQSLFGKVAPLQKHVFPGNTACNPTSFNERPRAHPMSTQKADSG